MLEGRGFVTTHEEEHLQQVMQQYGDEILRLCYTYVHSWQTAEDLTQETFLKFYRASGKFRGESTVKTYLFRIAINVCKDYLSSWKYQKIQLSNTLTTFLKSKDNLEQIIVEKSEQQLLVEKIEQLPLKYKDVLMLYYYAELPIAEVAETLGLPVNTVKTRLRRARVQLKLKIEEGEDFSEFA